ncbi:MAG: nuclear transport factor 2 family protein [Terracidiphilus sp.]
MTRFVSGFFVVLFSCCVALAQNPTSAAAQPSVMSAESPEIRQFQKIEDAWTEAINQRDQYGLELVLSPLFVDVSAGGEITTRNQQLAQLITGEDKIIHLEQKVITVRMLGDIAVANGTYVLHRKPGTAPAEEKGVYTHVFERAHGGWVCINSQRTKLPEESNPKGKRQPGAETPFHFPLLSR